MFTHVQALKLFVTSNLFVTNRLIFFFFIFTRGGAGMKNQVPVKFREFEKNQVRVGSGPRKILPEITCITSKVIHRP